eukprot:4371908-Pleurochrysis_carterae.AAC.2
MALLLASSFDLPLAPNLVGGDLEGQPPRNNPCQTAGELYQAQYAGSGRPRCTTHGDHLSSPEEQHVLDLLAGR